MPNIETILNKKDAAHTIGAIKRYAAYIEPFSPELAVQSRGSARWCGRDRAGGGGGARGDRSGMVCSDQFGVTTRGSPRGCPILPLAMFPSPSPAPSACGWPPTAGPMTCGRGPGRPPAGPRAVLVPGWMVAGTALTTLARDSRVSRATAYRYPLRGPGGDRRPGPGPSRGPSATARVERAERRPGRDPDPHRPGRSAQPGHGPPPVVLRSWGRRSGATCRW